MSALAAVARRAAAGRHRDRSCTTPAAIGTCSACSRTCSARTRWAIRNVLLVTGDPPRVGDYPDATAVFDVDSIGLTNVVARLNRRPRHRRAADRPADRVPHRRGGESRRARPRRRAAPLRVQGRGGRRVRDHPAGLRRRRRSRTFLRRIGGTRDSDPRRHHAAREPAPRRVHGQRGARRAVPDAVVERMRRAENDGRAAAEGLAIAREWRPRSGRWCRDCRFRRPPGRVDAALEVMERAAAVLSAVSARGPFFVRLPAR